MSNETHELLALVSAQTGVPVDALTEELDLTADLRLDSLSRVELLITLRTELRTPPEISVGDICEFRTLGDLKAAVEGKP